MATGYTATPHWPSSSTMTTTFSPGRPHDRARFFSLSDARYGAGSSSTMTQTTQASPSGKRLPSSLSLGGGTAMHTSFSSDSLLHSQKQQSSRSPPIALPPLRSLVDGINGIEGDREKSDSVSGPALPFRKSSASVSVSEAPPARGHARRASLATSVPDHNVVAKSSEVILNRIYSSSMALADYAQMSQQSFSGPTTGEMAKMQQFAADLNSLVLDLKYQADFTAVDRPRLPDPIPIKTAAPAAAAADHHHALYRDGAQSAEHRRRSSGAASFVSFDLNHNNNSSSSVRGYNYGSSSERRLSASLPRINGHHIARYSEGGGGDGSIYSDVSYHGYSSQDTPESGFKASPSSNSDNAMHGSNTSEQQLQQQAGRPHKYRKRSRAPAPGSCLACSVEETPEWRRGPGGARTLCNACGLHYSKMVRKVKNEMGDKGTKGNNNNTTAPLVSIEELRASILLPANSTNGSDIGSTTGTV